MFMYPLISAVAFVAFAAMAGCASAPAPGARPLMTAPSPVSFDGHVAGQATDIVFVLVPDADPAVVGLSMRAGEALRLTLPSAFRRNPAVTISADTDANLVLTKGWPQGAVRLAGQYRVGYDDRAHAMTVTALRDIAAGDANAPGIKVVHLRGRTFVNPAAGDYPVAVTQSAADGAPLATWQGRIRVLAEAPPARLAPTNFHLAPGSNAEFQQVAPGQLAPLTWGLLLWGPKGAPLDGVGIAPSDPAKYPRYTGGLLVQDSNRDRRLDAATDQVVGGIVGAAPQGATGQAATSPVGSDGTPVLSGEPLRHPGYPPAAGGGKPNPGLLVIQFRAGDKPGLYRPTVELVGGNGYQFTVEAKGQ